jgi:Zn-dependent alcohol dehydrogenase
MSGRAARLGAGVTVDSAGQPLAEGDRVAFLYFFPSGRCPVCLRDRNLRPSPYERLVSHVFPLARIGEAFEQADWMQGGGAGLRISRAALSMVD